MFMEKKKPAFRLCVLFLSAALFLSVLPAAGAAWENTHANTGNQAVDLAAVALTQMGYTDSANGVQESSKYGDWYGLPNAYWCAMFVSWCADQAGISRLVIPPFASCTTSIKTFQRMGRWQNGPYWGGTYTPKMGDLIYYDWSGTGISSHVGIVLYVEDGWVYSVEGNTLTNRLDEPEVFHSTTESTGPYVPDRVMVRAHQLNSIYIRGYATPAYSGTNIHADPLQGLIDLQSGSNMELEALRVVDAGLMDPMSSHTFGPWYGVTRGEYLTILSKYLGLTESSSGTTAFADVPETHPDYPAVMAFRSAGIIQGTGGNYFHPDEYITVSAASAILQRIYGLFGATAPSAGYTGDAKEGYLWRWEAAHALCILMNRNCAPAFQPASILLDDTPVTVNAMQYAGVNFVTLEAWSSLLTEEQAALMEESAAGLSFFSWNGQRWYKLRDAAQASGLAVDWDAAAALIRLTPVSAAKTVADVSPTTEEATDNASIAGETLPVPSSNQEIAA